MKITVLQSHRSLRRYRQQGLTLIEVSLVIALLLGLIAVLFFGISSYREGADRARCRIQVAQTQKAMRSAANVYNLKAAVGATAGDAITTAQVVGATGSLPTCPSGGTYTASSTVPALGSLYINCSLPAHAYATGANTETATW